jgi:hypothetical protein
MRIINRKQVGYLRVAQVPQWVQAKALLGYQGGEDPRQKIDLVDAFEDFNKKIFPKTLSDNSIQKFYNKPLLVEIIDKSLKYILLNMDSIQILAFLYVCKTFVFMVFYSITYFIEITLNLHV